MLSRASYPLNTSTQRGFTLLELMVVIAIIGLMTATVVVNVSGVLEQSELSKQTERLKTVLQLSSEEAVLFNRVYGIKFEDQGYHFMQLKRVELPVDEYGQIIEPVDSVVQAESDEQSDANNLGGGTFSNKDESVKTREFLRWQAIEANSSDRFFQKHSLPETLQLEVMVDGLSIDLSASSFASEDEEKKPTLIISPDGEIAPDFELSLRENVLIQTLRMDEKGVLNIEENKL